MVFLYENIHADAIGPLRDRNADKRTFRVRPLRGHHACNWQQFVVYLLTGSHISIYRQSPGGHPVAR